MGVRGREILRTSPPGGSRKSISSNLSLVPWPDSSLHGAFVFTRVARARQKHVGVGEWAC
jgi:hypothetical protein